VLLHGWEGSSSSLLVISGADRLWREGYRIVRINLRDHGDSQHLNRGIFHSCRLDEMVDATRWVGESFPGERLYLSGYSLGGNFALRIAAAAGPDLNLGGVVAICPVLDPEETMAALDAGSVIYRQYFLKKWRRSLERKARAFPDEYAFGPLDRFRSLREMTDYFVTRYTEFPTLESYLRGYAITGGRLASLRVPSAILMADDDPVIPAASVARLARPPGLTVERTRWGGHCGFLADYQLRTWSDDYLVRRFGEFAHSR
jgi:predicted alpha/beta-fold hydrolase